MIEVTGLSKKFGDVQALHDVSFTVPSGQVVGFLGANGAGKTTTMDILCGCIGADQGQAKVAGYDITEQPEEAKRRLGYLPDEPPIYSDMRVADFVRYAAKLRGVPKDHLSTRVDSTIEKLSLGDVRRRVIGNLSKGYRQRVAFAQAIVHDPEVLVLDEPTEGLDPNQIIQIRELIRSLKGQHTIILSSHILSEIQNTCDEIIIIHEGRILRQGSYEQIRANRSLASSYRLMVKREPEDLAATLQSMDGIHSVDWEVQAFGQVTFSFDGDEEILEKVLHAGLQGGHGILELVAQTESLEDVFFQLTRDNESQGTAVL